MVSISLLLYIPHMDPGPFTLKQSSRLCFSLPVSAPFKGVAESSLAQISYGAQQEYKKSPSESLNMLDFG